MAYSNDQIAAIDTDGVNVYWIDRAANIFKVPTGGGDVTQLNSTFTGGPSVPIRVLNGFVYWMDHYDKIKRVSVTGGTEITVATDLPFLSDFAVDATSVYFAEWDTGWIRKVPNTGGPATSLAQAQFGSLILLAIDNNQLYWLDSVKIGKVPVSGGTISILLKDEISGSSLTLDLTSLYWTDVGRGEIIKLTPK